MTRSRLLCAFALVALIGSLIACGGARRGAKMNAAEDYMDKGIEAADNKQYDKAIAAFTEAIKLDPNNADAYVHRGLAYDEKKEYDKAIADYTEAIRLDPKDDTAYHNRGHSYEMKKEYQKAIDDYNAALGINPEDSESQNSLAWVLATCPKDGLRDGKRALDLATKATKSPGGKKDAIYLDTLAAAHAETGNFPEAVRVQKKANKIGFEDAEEDRKAQKRLKLYEQNKPYRDND